ncbi:MAG: hypothetical protein M3Y59_13025 [Myxococcota bacterium]|nr:hypothetical protein [Myxococcota bacterium]
MRRVQRAAATGVLAGLIALGTGSGCAAAPPALVVPLSLPEQVQGSPPNPVAVAVTEAPPVPSPCGETIPGWRSFARPGRMVVLGEKPGSHEIPAFVGDAVCQAAQVGLAVHVALEIPRLEQPLVDAYLASEGTPDDRARLFRGGMWHRMYEDGRSSSAVADLIERVRGLRRAGQPVSLHFYDELQEPGSLKEQRLAANLVSLWKQAPRDLYVVLTGNIHARTVVGVAWDKRFEPMGYHLASALPDVLVLDAQYTGGDAWVCELSRWGRRLDCGARPAGIPRRAFWAQERPRLTDGRLASRFAGSFTAPSAEGYHGIFFVGRLTPAPPAVERIASR